MRRPALVRAALALSAILLTPFLAGSSSTRASDAHGPARNSFAFKLGGYFPDGDSDLWEFNSDELTTGPEDFNDFALGIEFDKQLSNYSAVAVEVIFYEGEDGSVDRAVGDLFQDSRLTLVPATISFKFQPGGKFRDGGPGYPGAQRTFVPYVSLGAGFVLWEFVMEGEFEDPADPAFFFEDRFVSDGIAPALTAAAGLEIALEGPWSLILEGKYLWAEDDLGNDFVGFDEFDLSGASFYAGAAFRF